MPKLLGPRFCTGFGLLTPMALAPMALASGGALASACARAGAWGLVGGGYGDLVSRHPRSSKKRQTPSPIPPGARCAEVAPGHRARRVLDDGGPGVDGLAGQHALVHAQIVARHALRAE